MQLPTRWEVKFPCAVIMCERCFLPFFDEIDCRWVPHVLLRPARGGGSHQVLRCSRPGADHMDLRDPEFIARDSLGAVLYFLLCPTCAEFWFDLDGKLRAEGIGWSDRARNLTSTTATAGHAYHRRLTEAAEVVMRDAAPTVHGSSSSEENIDRSNTIFTQA